MRVLIIEDEWLIATALADALADGGHEVVGPADSVEEAMALCEAASPELAILNIDLHDHLGAGLHIARTLRERWGVRSIFASGAIEKVPEARTVALAYIRKPYHPNTVLQAIGAAQEILQGGKPTALPGGVEWFADD